MAVPKTAKKPRRKSAVLARASGHLTKEQVIGALRASAGIRSLAAKKLRVNRATVTSFLNKHPDLVAIEHEIVAAVSDLAVDKLIGLIMEGDFRAIKYYLDNKGQEHGFGVRKNAFSDGDGTTIIPGILVVPKRELDADAWAGMAEEWATQSQLPH